MLVVYLVSRLVHALSSQKGMGILRKVPPRHRAPGLTLYPRLESLNSQIRPAKGNQVLDLPESKASLGEG